MAHATEQASKRGVDTLKHRWLKRATARYNRRTAKAMIKAGLEPPPKRGFSGFED
jgi:hypothetical protein